MQPENIKRQTNGLTALYQLLLLTVPIEDVAHWHYEISDNIPS